MILGTDTLQSLPSLCTEVLGTSGQIIAVSMFVPPAGNKVGLGFFLYYL